MLIGDEPQSYPSYRDIALAGFDHRLGDRHSDRQEIA
jgi:hypothetical protein